MKSSEHAKFIKTSSRRSEQAKQDIRAYYERNYPLVDIPEPELDIPTTYKTEVSGNGSLAATTALSLAGIGAYINNKPKTALALSLAALGTPIVAPINVRRVVANEQELEARKKELSADLKRKLERNRQTFVDYHSRPNKYTLRYWDAAQKAINNNPDITTEERNAILDKYLSIVAVAPDAKFQPPVFVNK